jgi:transposase
MLNNASGFKKVYLATGVTDLRRGIEGLASIVRFEFQLDPYDKDTLFLFCGRKSDRIKGLIWEGDGFLLVYKRLANGRFRWPKSQEEMRQMTSEQYKRLMDGFTIEPSIRRSDARYIL